jgi:hypothetical protein
VCTAPSPEKQYIPKPTRIELIPTAELPKRKGRCPLVENHETFKRCRSPSTRQVWWVPHLGLGWLLTRWWNFQLRQTPLIFVPLCLFLHEHVCCQELSTFGSPFGFSDSLLLPLPRVDGGEQSLKEGPGPEMICWKGSKARVCRKE